MLLRFMALVAVLATATGCTGIGMHTSARDQVDYGPPQVVRVCLMKTADVPDGRAEALIAAVNEEFETFGISVVVPWTREWQRAGLMSQDIVEHLMTYDLEEDCDRLVGLIDRHAGDFVWSLFLPQILGAVETITHTHGYVVATAASLGQMLPRAAGGVTPKVAAVHEFYHLVGCPHAATKTRCYEQIAELKASRPPGSDFLPGVNPEGKFLLTRAEVNDTLKRGLAEYEKAKQERRRRNRQTAASGSVGQ